MTAGQALLPLLRHVLPYVGQVSILSAHVLVIIEGCLSASFFSDHAWKTGVLRTADSLLHLVGEADRALLQARIHIRQAAVSRLFERYREPATTIDIVDKCSNGFAAEQILGKAQNLIDLGLLASASNELAKYKPELYGRSSTLERAQYQAIMFTRGKVLRYEGRFADAFLLLEACMSHDQLALRCIRHLAAVECELGRNEAAIRRLELWSASHASGRRVRLALATAHVARILAALRGARPVSHMIGPAKDLLDAVWGRVTQPAASKVCKLDRVTTAIGHAILQHIAGNIGQAVFAWQQASLACKEYDPVPGYFDMVVAYAHCELEVRRGNLTEASLLESRARALFAGAGRQYYLTSLGTLWPDIVGDWFEASGRDRIIY